MGTGYHSRVSCYLSHINTAPETAPTLSPVLRPLALTLPKPWLLTTVNRSTILENKRFQAVLEESHLQ